MSVFLTVNVIDILFNFHGVCVPVSLTGVQMDHVSLLKQFEHLDPHNQNTFEAKDLELLIATVSAVIPAYRIERRATRACGISGVGFVMTVCFFYMPHGLSRAPLARA